MSQYISVRALNRSSSVRVVNSFGDNVELSTTADTVLDLDLASNRRSLARHSAIGQYVVSGTSADSVDLGSPAVGAVAAVRAAHTDTGSQVVLTSGITNPAVPRNITATAGGTAADVKAIQVIVTGTDAQGDEITETLPAFTVNTTGTVTGNKAFATVTSITIPAHDGTGATTSIGTGAKLGLGALLAKDTILNAYLGGVREGTRPTVAFSSTVLADNTVTLNSALNGTAVSVDFLR